MKHIEVTVVKRLKICNGINVMHWSRNLCFCTTVFFFSLCRSWSFWFFYEKFLSTCFSFWWILFLANGALFPFLKTNSQFMFENFYNKSNYIEGLGSCIKHILRMKMLLEQRAHTLSLPQIQTNTHTRTSIQQKFGWKNSKEIDWIQWTWKLFALINKWTT